MIWLSISSPGQPVKAWFRADRVDAVIASPLGSLVVTSGGFTFDIHGMTPDVIAAKVEQALKNNGLLT